MPRWRKEIAMKVTVNATNYRFSHGRSPKGTGMWMFLRFLNQEELVVAEGFGTYSDVRAKAIAKAKELGITEIHAGS